MNRIKLVDPLSLLTTCFFFLCMVESCKKFIKLEQPKTQLTSSSVFENDGTATAAVIGIYSSMSKSEIFNMSLYTGFSSDELEDYSGSRNTNEFYTNSISINNDVVRITLWSNPYRHIYEANSILEGLEKSSLISAPVRNQLKGEAMFIRAFHNFYLLSMFGDVPDITTADYLVNKSAVRTPKAEMLEHVISDLQNAKSLLSEEYMDGANLPGTERTRPNSWAAGALLARAYLYQQNWAAAEQMSTDIINDNTRYNLLPDLDAIFLKNSDEAIWQLMPVYQGLNTDEGNLYILSERPSTCALTGNFINSFEAGDTRKTSWTNYYVDGVDTFYFPYKYKIKSSSPGEPYEEYEMILRIAEQYLIRAEARLHLNNLPGALADINLIRTRAMLPEIVVTDPAEIAAAIEQERRVELFTEVGHRWFDLVRTNRAGEILSPLKGANWQSSDQLYPIPQTELIADPNLTQNPGY